MDHRTHYETNSNQPQLLIDREAHSVASLPRQSPDTQSITINKPIEVPAQQPTMVERHVHREQMIVFDVPKTPENIRELHELTHTTTAPHDHQNHRKGHPHQQVVDGDKHLHHKHRHAHDVGHAPHDHTHRHAERQYDHHDEHRPHDYRHDNHSHNHHGNHPHKHHDNHHQARKLRPEDDPLTGTIGSPSTPSGTTGFGNIAGPYIERPSGLATAGTFPSGYTEIHKPLLHEMEISPGTYYSPLKVGGDRFYGESGTGSRDDYTTHTSIKTKVLHAERELQESFGGPAGKEWNRMT